MCTLDGVEVCMMHVYLHTLHYISCTDKKLFPDMRKVIEGTEVSPYIIGGSAYPLLA